MLTSMYVTLTQLCDERPFLTERWVRRMVAQRRIPHYKLGGKLVFDLGEVDDMVRSHRVSPAAPRSLR